MSEHLSLAAKCFNFRSIYAPKAPSMSSIPQAMEDVHPTKASTNNAMIQGVVQPTSIGHRFDDS